MKTKEESFTKTDTKIIKGLAIILMLMHHLWGFPERIMGGELKYIFNIFDKSSISIIGSFSKICVSIFFFVGGYGIYKKSKEKDFNILNNIKKIYVNYWKIFLIFIPVGFLFFNKQPAYTESPNIYNVFLKFSFQDVLSNFFGFSSSLNPEWWFLNNYIIAVISFKFIKDVFENKKTSTNIFIIIITTILMYNVFPTIGRNEKLGLLNNNYLYSTFFCQIVPYVSCFWLGILFAKDDLFGLLKEKINNIIRINPFIDIIGLMSIVYLREFIVGGLLDILYVPVLIVLFIDLVKGLSIFKKTFVFLGNHSTNIWLIHSFYCYYFYFFVKIVMHFRWAFPCFIVLLLLSIISSIIINYFWKGLFNFYNLINNKVSNKSFEKN